MGVTLFISLLTTRLVLNALGATDYGVFGVVGGAIAMLGFLNGAMAGTTQRFMSYSQGKGDIEGNRVIFNNSFILHCLIALIIVIVLEVASYPLFNGILNIPNGREETAKTIYQFLIISTFFTVLSVPYDASINAHEDMGYYSVVAILESILKLVVAVIIVYTIKDKLFVYGFMMALLTILVLFIKYLYCRNRYVECKVNIRKYYQEKTIKQLLSYAGWSFVDVTGAMIGINGSEVVMNHYFGPSVNAAGSVSVQLRGQLMALSNNLIKALNPVIVKKEGGGDRNGMLAFSITGSKIAYILFAILALPFIIEAPLILKLWLKNIPDWTVCFVRFQILIGLSLQLSVTLKTALGASGVIRNNCIFNGIAHIIPLFLFILIFSMGSEPYWSYLIIFINYAFVLFGFLLHQCYINCGLNVRSYLSRTLIPCIVSSLIACIVGAFINTHMIESFTRLFIVIISVDSVFVVISYFLILDKKERFYLSTIISNFKKYCSEKL